MRIALLVAVVLSGGCSEWEQTLPFAPDGVLHAATRGVVIHDSGDQANAAMYDTTCFVDPSTGFIGEDRDYPGSDEEVDDVGRFEGAEVVLVTSDRGVHVTPADPYAWEEGDDDVLHPGVLEARLAGDDIVLLAEDLGCTLTWASDGDGTYLDPSACATQRVTVDPVSTDAWVVTGQGVVQAQHDGGSQIVDAEADLAVYDPFTERLYLAVRGDSVVRARESDGALAWETDLGFPVWSLDDLGWREGVAALVDTRFESRVYLLDGWTGEAVLADSAPAGANEVVFARNGRDFALVTDDEVHFREVPRHVR